MNSSTYIRKTSLNLGYANAGKVHVLDEILEEYRKVVNKFIDLYWDPNCIQRLPKFSSEKVETWLSVRLQQVAGKVAIQNIKSQIKKKKKVKPVYRGDVIDLDERFWKIEDFGLSFDVWVVLGSLGRKIQLKLPSRKQKHFLKLSETGKMLKSCRLRREKGKWFIDVFFEFISVPFRSASINILNRGACSPSVTQNKPL